MLAIGKLISAMSLVVWGIFDHIVEFAAEESEFVMAAKALRATESIK